MPWLRNGHFYQFNEESILARAPASSGVYGIYNIRHQLIIGHTGNLRETLLRFKGEIRFRLERFKPTGFTFEECGLDVREPRARALIAEYQPVLNDDSGLPLAALWRSWNYRGASAFHPPPPRKKPQLLLPPPAPKEETTHLSSPAPGPQFTWRGFATAAAVLAVMVGGLYSWRAGERRFKRQIPIGNTANAANSASNSLQAVPEAQAREPAAPQNLATPAKTNRNAAGKNDLLVAQAEKQPAEPANAGATKGQPAADGKARNDATKKAPAAKTGVLRYNGQSPWNVQVRATAKRAEANNVLGRLRARGYDAFLTESMVKGQMWYRVRVGNLANQKQAEALQRKLQAGGYPDAFVANGAELTAGTKPNR